MQLKNKKTHENFGSPVEIDSKKANKKLLSNFLSQNGC